MLLWRSTAPPKPLRLHPLPPYFMPTRLPPTGATFDQDRIANSESTTESSPLTWGGQSALDSTDASASAKQLRIASRSDRRILNFDLNIVMVRQFLKRSLATLFDKKAIEFGTKGKVYCHRPACSAFLGTATAPPSRLTCPQCGYSTCGHCKATRHFLSKRCTAAEDATVVELAEQLQAG